MSIKIKKFTESNYEYSEMVRIYNIVSHDDSTHINDEKDNWSIRDKNIRKDRLFLYKNDKIVGFLRYSQGKAKNKSKFFFNIFIDPSYSGNRYRQKLFDRLLYEVKKFDCNGLYMDVFDHPNYEHSKAFLINNNFICKFSIREYSLDLSTINFKKYSMLLKELDKTGIKFYDGRDELSKNKNYYQKLEELRWTYSQDFPVPEGIVMTRDPYDQFLKEQKLFEDKRYGIEIIAIYNQKFIGSTDVHVYPNSDSTKAWTGGLGVLREFRRRGIATVLKLKAYEKLILKGIKTVRTDNEKNNPMYLINIKLGFKPEPYRYEYQKEI